MDDAMYVSAVERRKSSKPGLHRDRDFLSAEKSQTLRVRGSGGRFDLHDSAQTFKTV